MEIRTFLLKFRQQYRIQDLRLLYIECPKCLYDDSFILDNLRGLISIILMIICVLLFPLRVKS